LIKWKAKVFSPRKLKRALLRKEIDVAVHSMKDLPTTSPEGLAITASPIERTLPTGWSFVNQVQMPKHYSGSGKRPSWAPLQPGAKAQLLHYRPDIQIKDIRGNVPTRLRKLDEGQFDAIMLAAAGADSPRNRPERLRSDSIQPQRIYSCSAQGVLAWQVRKDDKATRRVFQRLHQASTSAVTNIERKALQLLEGGCQMPVGIYCEQDQNSNFHIWAAMAESWDAPVKHARLSQSTSHRLAERVVEALRSEHG
jgi:hydroxymethylbilane synthase